MEIQRQKAQKYKILETDFNFNMKCSQIKNSNFEEDWQFKTSKHKL